MKQKVYIVVNSIVALALKIEYILLDGNEY